MSHFRLLFLAVGVTALTAFWACDSSPTSSTSPSGPSVSNRVSGAFVSETGAAVRQTARASSSFEGITVSVRQDGTITVDVSSNGTFTLEGVPVGRVTVVFTRDGTEIGEIDIHGVGSSEEIRMMLELSGDTVVLLEMERGLEDGEGDDESSDADSEDDESEDEESEDDESSEDEDSEDDESDDDSDSSST